MKSLLVLSFITLSAFIDSPEMTFSNSQGIEMQLSSETVFQEKVKIFDYNGALLKEYELTDVVNGEITTSDQFTLKESDFAFSYLGDYYYFSEAKGELVVN